VSGKTERGTSVKVATLTCAAVLVAGTLIHAASARGSAAPVFEPGSMILFGTGLIALAGVVRRGAGKGASKNRIGNSNS